MGKRTFPRPGLDLAMCMKVHIPEEFLNEENPRKHVSNPSGASSNPLHGRYEELMISNDEEIRGGPKSGDTQKEPHCDFQTPFTRFSEYLTTV